MFVERGGKYLCWTWQDYDRDVRNFAKALASLSVTKRSACCIMGFNSPEWAVAFMGSIMYETVSSGIYITNAPEACLYQATHSEAEIIVVETLDHLKRFTVNLDKLPKVKAFVVWGEETLPAEFQGSRYFLWKDFLKIGNHIGDDIIAKKMDAQVPGQCCCLIYTSGTTGMPKGCMLSHDNIVWESVEMMELIASEKPELTGP